MPMDTTTLITGRYPPGDLYQPDIRTEYERRDPPYVSAPYTSLLDDAAHTVEDAVENSNRQWAAGFPARIRAGQSLHGTGVVGVRVSPLDMPERIRGRMVAVSI